MKNTFFNLLLIAIIFSSCTAVKEIGKINMISTRNVDPKLDYKSLNSYAGGSEHELKKSKAKNIQEAVDETVKKIPGGEFLMNAKIYLISEKYFAVEGDVWGSTRDANGISFRGFKVGDKVTWKKMGKYRTGTFKAFKTNNSCLVDSDEQNKTIELNYDDITKLEK
jgi:hypothetical protein